MSEQVMLLNRKNRVLSALVGQGLGVNAGRIFHDVD
jgi:hypothetical protein